MPDLTAIAQALTALKAAKDIAEAMMGLRDASAFQTKLLEFQSKIIDANNAAFHAQDERSSMLERIRNLEQQVTEFEAWETEKQRYELQDIAKGRGGLAYMIKPSMLGSEPVHCICANCYQQRKKRILQMAIFQGLANRHLVCPECFGQHPNGLATHTLHNPFCR